MAERVRLGAGAPSPAAPPADSSPADPPLADEGPAKHCWVADAIDRHGVKRPGLLVEWRQAAVGWEGRVLYAAMLRPGEWAVVEEWLPAELLTPR